MGRPGLVRGSQWPIPLPCSPQAPTGSPSLCLVRPFFWARSACRSRSRLSSLRRLNRRMRCSIHIAMLNLRQRPPAPRRRLIHLVGRDEYHHLLPNYRWESSLLRPRRSRTHCRLLLRLLDGPPLSTAPRARNHRRFLPRTRFPQKERLSSSVRTRLLATSGRSLRTRLIIHSVGGPSWPARVCYLAPPSASSSSPMSDFAATASRRGHLICRPARRSPSAWLITLASWAWDSPPPLARSQALAWPPGLAGSWALRRDRRTSDAGECSAPWAARYSGSASPGTRAFVSVS